MPFVLDSSMAMAMLLREETLIAPDSFFERLATDGAVVPILWRFEIANSLLMAVRKSRITRIGSLTRIGQLEGLPIEVDMLSALNVNAITLPLADHHGLTVYDAAYLELAIRLSLPLATLDKALARAAQAEDVEVIGG